MIKIYTIKNKKFNEKLKLKDIKSNSVKNNFLFIDCINPTKQEIDEISSRFSISRPDIRLALDKEARPRIMDLDDYSMIIFASAKSSKLRVATSSFGMFICNNSLIIIRKDKLSALERFGQLKEDQKLKELSKGRGYMAYLMIDFVFDNYFRIMDLLEDDINMLETRVFKNPDQNTVRRIFRIKTDLIYLHKALTANREVISCIEKGYIKYLNEKDIKRFRYVYNDAAELIDIEGTYRDILTGTLDIYLSSVSNNLNEVMKKMTAMASFILIPTLISGIYGMNFRVFPEIQWQYGYVFAIGLMVVSVITMYVYFKKKQWL